jgi:hypothetical protein
LVASRSFDRNREVVVAEASLLERRFTPKVVVERVEAPQKLELFDWYRAVFEVFRALRPILDQLLDTDKAAKLEAFLTDEAALLATLEPMRAEIAEYPGRRRKMEQDKRDHERWMAEAKKVEKAKEETLAQLDADIERAAADKAGRRSW